MGSEKYVSLSFQCVAMKRPSQWLISFWHVSSHNLVMTSPTTRPPWCQISRVQIQERVLYMAEASDQSKKTVRSQPEHVESDYWDWVIKANFTNRWQSKPFQMTFSSKYSNSSSMQYIFLSLYLKSGVRLYTYVENGEIWRLHLHITWTWKSTSGLPKDRWRRCWISGQNYLYM